MEITVDDLVRLTHEIDSREQTGAEWTEHTGIAFDAMATFLQDAGDTVIDQACCQEHVRRAVVEVAGTAFRLGWELRDQYGRNEDRNTLCAVHKPGECPPGCEHAFSFDDDPEVQ